MLHDSICYSPSENPLLRKGPSPPPPEDPNEHTTAPPPPQDRRRDRRWRVGDHCRDTPRRDDSVASLHREILEAVAALFPNSEDGNVDGDQGEDDAPLPSVLITGFRAHGKSSLVNTACRALAGEEGPLLLRAEASPPGSGSDGTRKLRRVKAVVSGTDGEMAAEEAVVELLDAQPLPEAARLTREDIQAAINGGDPECVVLRCDAPAKERNAAVKRLPEISAAVRAKGQ